MFNPTTANLWLEVKKAMEETEQHSEGANDIMRRVTGRWYRKDLGEMEPEPENFGYAFMSNMLPTFSSGNPGAAVKAKRVIGHKIIQQAMEDGIESVVEDLDWAEVHEPVYVDYMASRGVTMHYLDEETRFSRGNVKPMVVRVNFRNFFIDALAEDTVNDEFRGHWYWVDEDDLQDDEDVIPETLAMLTPGEDASLSSQTRRSPYNRTSGSQLGRRRIKCYSVWMRARNTIRVLVESSEVAELYKERPYYGPKCGPYQLYDAYPVPGQAWPLPPLVAVEDQARDLNIHARAMGRAAARRKVLGLVEANNPDLGNKIEDAEDGEVVPVKGITGNFVQIELGAATDKTFQFVEYVRGRLDRISGLTATVQGSVGQADTATEAKIADDALGARVKFLKNRILRATGSSLWKVGWYCYHTEGIVIPVNRRDPYTGEVQEGLFFGGPMPTDGGATWDDFGMEIRVNTMQMEVTARENILTFYQLWKEVMTLAPQMPWARWMNVLRDLEDALKVPGKADEWSIPELFGAFSQPPMTPPSMVLGGQQPPQRGAPSRVGMPRSGQPGGVGRDAGPGSPQNQITSAGVAAGPRPQQTGGSASGLNPLNRVA